MNSRLVAFSLVLLLFSACNKDTESQNDLSCYKLIKNSAAINILPASDLNTIDSLFNSNNISQTNLQFYRTEVSSATNYRYVKAHQFANGLEVFFDDLVFSFDMNGQFDEVFGDRIATINLGNTPNMKPEDLVGIFRSSVNADLEIKDYKSLILAECVNVEFGYFDENAGAGGTQASYVNAWRLTIDDYGVMMLVNDKTGDVILYDNGIRTF